MIIGSKFPGDDHDAAMSVQHALYGEAVGMLARLARDRLARADLAAGGETVIGSLLRGRTSFDHRVLQDAHDLIAAEFRFTRHGHLFRGAHETERVWELRIAGLWWAFLVKEADRLLERADFLHAILSALAFQNSPAGYRAEDEARVILETEYMEWAAGCL
jgi:hypothetical protein